MNEFKVGDIIKGKKNGYRYTNATMTKGEVLSIDNDENKMNIKALESTSGYISDVIFTVKNSKDKFELISSPVSFKCGDMITGKSCNGYPITNDDMIKGVVIGLYPEDGMMKVKILEHKDIDFKGYIFDVNNSIEYFEPYKKNTHKGVTIVASAKPVAISPSALVLDVATDGAKKVIVSSDKYLISTEANCDLSCDEFDYEYGLGLAIERFGKELKSRAVGKKKKYVKLCNLMRSDVKAGLTDGDIVEVIEELDKSIVCDNSCIFVRCNISTFIGNKEERDKSEKYDFPVQFIMGTQYTPVKHWEKSSNPTKYAKVLKSGYYQSKAGLVDGDIVEILVDKKIALYVKSPNKNRAFCPAYEIDTVYFTFLGDTSDWEYVTPIF